MSNSVKLKTPVPTSSQVARSLGIDSDRHAFISRLAEDTVARYYAKPGTKAVKGKVTPKRSKAA